MMTASFCFLMAFHGLIEDLILFATHAMYIRPSLEASSSNGNPEKERLQVGNVFLLVIVGICI